MQPNYTKESFILHPKKLKERVNIGVIYWALARKRRDIILLYGDSIGDTRCKNNHLDNNKIISHHYCTIFTILNMGNKCSRRHTGGKYILWTFLLQIINWKKSLIEHGRKFSSYYYFTICCVETFLTSFQFWKIWWKLNFWRNIPVDHQNIRILFLI